MADECFGCGACVRQCVQGCAGSGVGESVPEVHGGSSCMSSCERLCVCSCVHACVHANHTAVLFVVAILLWINDAADRAYYYGLTCVAITQPFCSSSCKPACHPKKVHAHHTHPCGSFAHAPHAHPRANARTAPAGRCPIVKQSYPVHREYAITNVLLFMASLMCHEHHAALN